MTFDCSKALRSVRHLAGLLLSSALFGGCASEAERQTEAATAWKASLPASWADYGSPPLEHFRLFLKAFMASSLRDPASAQYGEFMVPQKSYAIVDADRKKVVYGYASCVYVNAKNSYGIYTGNHMFWFLSKNNEVLLSRDLTDTAFLAVTYQNNLVKCLDYHYETQ